MEILTKDINGFYNYATMRLFMAYSIWERFHGSLYLDWYDCEELAHQTFEGKTAEIEQALESIYSEDRQTALETYNECYDMELGNPNYLDENYEAYALFDKIAKEKQAQRCQKCYNC